MITGMASTPPQPHRNLWPATVLMAIVIVCVTGLAWRGVDANVLLILFGGSLLPLLLQLYGIAAKTEAQTNGNNAALMAIVKDMGDKLYAATPAPPLGDQAPPQASTAGESTQPAANEPWAAGYVDDRGRPLAADGSVIDLQGGRDRPGRL